MTKMPSVLARRRDTNTTFSF